MARDELQTLPGIGPSLAADLRLVGVASIKTLQVMELDGTTLRRSRANRQDGQGCANKVFADAGHSPVILLAR